MMQLFRISIRSSRSLALLHFRQIVSTVLSWVLSGLPLPIRFAFLAKCLPVDLRCLIWGALLWIRITAWVSVVKWFFVVQGLAKHLAHEVSGHSCHYCPSYLLLLSLRQLAVDESLCEFTDVVYPNIAHGSYHFGGQTSRIRYALR